MNDLKAAIDYTFVFLEDELADAKKKYHEAEQLRIDKENNPEKNWNWKWKDGGYWPTHHEAQARKVQNLTTALTALRDAQARQEGCFSCKNRFWYFTDYRFNPNYCPSCGRHIEPVGNADMLPTVSKTERVEEEEP